MLFYQLFHSHLLIFAHLPIQIVDTHAKNTGIAETGESSGHDLRPIKENGDND